MAWGRPKYNAAIRLCDIQTAIENIPFRTPVMNDIEKFITDVQFQAAIKWRNELLKKDPDAGRYLDPLNRETFSPEACSKDRSYYEHGQYYSDELLNTLNMDKPTLEYGSPDYRKIKDAGGVSKWEKGDGVIRSMESDFHWLLNDSRYSYEAYCRELDCRDDVCNNMVGGLKTLNDSFVEESKEKGWEERVPADEWLMKKFDKWKAEKAWDLTPGELKEMEHPYKHLEK
ncbi:hypothetical protein LCGC14_1212870 [marine sediment metagenome]|uniref:Uncharacterized protein n=1 Tax=marine sediment metagenome TaxID=412755 RepID=A0A0F9PI55_9ZZZZ